MKNLYLLTTIIITISLVSCKDKNDKETVADKDNTGIKIHMDNEKSDVDTSCDGLFKNHGKCLVPDKKTIFNLPVGDSPFKGPADALVTIVEFSDFQCPACAGWATQIFPGILEKYPNDVRLVFKHFPLDFHDLAKTASLISMEIKSQKGNEGFWKFHDLVFANQKDLNIDKLIEYAKTVGADTKLVEKAVENQKYKDALKKEMDMGLKAGVSGTPWVYINGELFARNTTLDSIIEKKLAAAKALVKAGTKRVDVYKKITDHGKTHIEEPIEKSEYENMMKLVKTGFLKRCNTKNDQISPVFEVMRRCSKEKPADCGVFIKCVEDQIKILKEKAAKN